MRSILFLLQELLRSLLKLLVMLVLMLVLVLIRVLCSSCSLFSFSYPRLTFMGPLWQVMSGIPYWTTDIGGFGGGNTSSADFRELVVRWFQVDLQTNNYMRIPWL